MKLKKAIIFTDGAAEPNPGPAAIGAVIKDEQGRLHARISQPIGIATNNQAEYQAIIVALEKAMELGFTHVELHSDSELVVKQVNGEYRVKKAALKPLYDKVRELLVQLEGCRVTHILRKKNKEADKLANEALGPVSNLPPAESYRLMITVIQAGDRAGDIASLYRLIDILKDFPGKAEVNLRVISEGKTIKLKLSDMYINYCPELHQQLAGLVGEEGIRVEPADFG